ncbi:MAG: hypothetical protein WGN25_13255 [Candidatus Electrothrix sp. GW3-4]|uniref:hypothetical protein n=1 Tax=Candidatus Electrothrix sp. GW3-4 TaxID=3126740 RepID=UPI0030D45244
MKWGEWLENWSMTSLKIKAPFLDMEWNPCDEDKDAAWELYTELLTRITTQNLPIETGDEKTALESVFKIFGLTRETIKTHGRKCIEFTKIAVVVLNQVIRPFTAKWHRCAVSDGFSDEEICKDFRDDLVELQQKLRLYTRMLSDMAGVEDLTELEEN